MMRLVIAASILLTTLWTQAADLQQVAIKAEDINKKAGAISQQVEELAFRIEGRENDISVILDKINLLQTQIYALNSDLDQVRALKDCPAQ